MDIHHNIQFLIFLNIYTNSVSGRDIPHLDKPTVDILDGEVTVFWDHPVDARSKSFKYNVEMAKYGGEWAAVRSCTNIRVPFCDLSKYIHDYSAAYKVRVQLVVGDEVSEWAVKKKFLINTSELQPPVFTLWATSSTLTIKVQPQPILKKIFPFGLRYTIYLQEKGQNNKNTTAYLTDDFGDDQKSKTFTSLSWGKEYCISVKVESISALSSSAASQNQCLQLPEGEWFTLAVSSLSILGFLSVIAVMIAILFCFLKRPEKTPVALTSPVSGWLPLSVGEDLMEVVTDKAWFFTLSRADVTNCITKKTEEDLDEKADRRTSMDSGVNMEPDCVNNGGSPPMRHEDSGFGSMGGRENSLCCSARSDYPVEGETTERKRGDSGVGLGCQLDCSVNLGGQDVGPSTEGVVGGGYHSQNPPAGQNHFCDEDMFKEILPECALAEVVTGYRAGHRPCMCSGTGRCAWCQNRDAAPELIKEYRATRIENMPVYSKKYFVDSYDELKLPNYHKKTDTLTVADADVNQTFPLLTSFSSLPLVDAGQDFNMNNISLSLFDVELNTD
ncbi:interleukin-10 receptor subunit alpha [Thalassophryne amazonica]|uniref:interleukin-10 receptor subunit alpha n=1 Tax=Thalassophryne amazonica TaxID=390379 RepID=UPI00147268C1|nr:interleukin-10 receptor subunit alpha [Thalassophryne amazonica]